ncbi:polysaccharide biosynthesis/export family protein [Moraxella sp. ZY21109]|uniref:polysaccharide biosynthesis/export family protein n=1 Tax=Moraxella sp. ZY21109 TaxID=2911969 RepID=UPI003D7C3B4A
MYRATIVKSYSSFFLPFSLCVLITGCAIAPGFQTYDLPTTGSYQTEQGAMVNIIPITQHNLMEINRPQPITPVPNKTQNLATLFSNNTPVQYHLQPYDVLSIQMWAYPEITPPITINNEVGAKSAGYQIDATGHIELPLIGRYKASGKTVAQISKELRQLFARYLTQPDPIVRVLSYESQRYSVQGNVNRSGQFYFDNQPVSVYTALGLAGGISQTGDQSAITLIRNGVSYQLNPLDLEKTGYSLHKLLLKPNDTLYVGAKENQKVYVMGESGKNQAITLREQGMTLSDTLGESLGVNPMYASAKRIYILRTDLNSKQTNIYVMDLATLGNFGLANQFAMNRNDIVYVDATGIARWQRIVSQLVPFSSAINSFAQLGN